MYIAGRYAFMLPCIAVSVEEYTLLQKMNELTAGEFTDMHNTSTQLNQAMHSLNDKCTNMFIHT